MTDEKKEVVNSSHKVIQIAVSGYWLYALCENGRIAALDTERSFSDPRSWYEVAEIPGYLFTDGLPDDVKKVIRSTHR
jgi:hypothetical protein